MPTISMPSPASVSHTRERSKCQTHAIPTTSNTAPSNVTAGRFKRSVPKKWQTIPSDSPQATAGKALPTILQYSLIPTSHSSDGRKSNNPPHNRLIAISHGAYSGRESTNREIVKASRLTTRMNGRNQRCQHSAHPKDFRAGVVVRLAGEKAALEQLEREIDAVPCHKRQIEPNESRAGVLAKPSLWIPRQALEDHENRDHHEQRHRKPPDGSRSIEPGTKRGMEPYYRVGCRQSYQVKTGHSRRSGRRLRWLVERLGRQADQAHDGLSGCAGSQGRVQDSRPTVTPPMKNNKALTIEINDMS